VESSVQYSLWPGILVAQTVSMVQSGAKVVVYQATSPYLPPDPDLGCNVS